MDLVFSLGIAIPRQTSITGTGQAARPVNTVRPALTGTVQQGQMLTADTGAWMGNPTGYIRQWRRNGAAILGATAATYMLQAVDVGSTISVAVTAANAAGTTVATSVESAPVTSAAPDYFVVAVQGQSGIKFALGSDIGNTGTPYNLTTSDRPAITGSFGRYVDKDGDTITGVSIGDGLFDLEVNNANYQVPVGTQMVPRGAVAVAQFMKFMAPEKEPVLLVLSKSGTSMDDMMDSADTARYWQSAKSAIDYVQETYAPIDLYVHSWQGSEPLDASFGAYTATRGVHWLGELFDGTKHTLGRSRTNEVPPTGGQAIDAYLFDVNPTADYKGILPYGTDMKLAFAFGSGPNMGDVPTRASVKQLLADPRLASMSLGTYTIPTYSHVDDRNADSPLNAMMILGLPILKALGQTVLTPTITGMVANATGTEVTVTVDLPNGGNLTTVRDQRGIAEPGVGEALASYLPVFGFETAAPAAAANTKLALTNAEWTAQITNAGTGTAPSRTGTVKLTRTSAFVTDTQFSYRLGGPGTSSTQEPDAGSGDPRIDQAFFNYLIEEVPAWQQAGVEWPFPGIEVAPMDTMTAVTVTGVVASDPVPLSSVMVLGETPSLPEGLVAGDRVYVLAGSHSAGPPSATEALAAGWANISIGGAGPSGLNNQVSFRYVWKTWVDGDTMPAFAGAAFVEAYRVPANYTHFINPNTYAATGFAPALSTATAPALVATLPAGSWHLIHTASRSASQALIDLTAAGFTRIGGIGGSDQYVTWRKGPTASVGAAGAVVMPTAFGPKAGGVIHLGFNPQ